MSKQFRKLKKAAKNRTTEDEKSSLIYASYLEKIKAFITDLFMIYTPILYITVYGIVGSKEEFQDSNLAPFIAVFIYGIIYAILLAKFGQTPGKKAYNIKVVSDKSNENLSFFAAFIRFVSFLFGVTILIGIFLPFYNKQKKSFHDYIAKSIEIKIET
jgi:uncharacterized RDD family membrane protein YckC